MSRPLIVWSDPPPSQGPGSELKYAKYIEVLRERPGEWACLRRNEKRTALDSMRVSLRGDHYQALARPYELEVTVRRTDGGDFGLWARLSEQP